MMEGRVIAKYLSTKPPPPKRTEALMQRSQYISLTELPCRTDSLKAYEVIPIRTKT
jgi:hypothetical protein